MPLEPPPARAVEVVAMFGDSVVGVKHCVAPGDGKVKRTTWAVAAVGVIGLVSFAATFWSAVDRAADNERHYRYETEVLGKPSYAVRPRALPGAFDVLAFGGLVTSIVTCTVALARISEERRSPYVRIGMAPGVDFPVADKASFELVAPHAGSFALRFPDDRAALDPIPANATVRVNVGATSFLVSAIEPPRRQAVPLFELDSKFARTLAGTAAVFGILFVLLLQIPVDAGSTTVEISPVEETTTHAVISDRTTVPQHVDQSGDTGESGGSGRSMALDAGKMGRADSPRLAGTYMLREQLPDPQLARQEAIEHAREAGILGSSALTGDVMASITGTSDFSSGFEDVSIYGGKLGVAPGEMSGGFGYSRSSFGPGGGGTGWGSICAGDFGTIGHGSGTGEGYGVGGGRCGMNCRGHIAATPTVSIGQPMAIGDLDKAIIRRYVRRNIDKISYCYEKQLLAKPDLAGTVSTQFFIAPTGMVTSATASGPDPAVANCIADVISNIEFPKPSGGGGVQVSYPFTIRTAGQ